LGIEPMDAARFFEATLNYRWIRLPAAGERESWTGLSRSVLNYLILPSHANSFRPLVISASLAKPGQRKATRLIHLKSLLDYVRGCADTTELNAVQRRRNQAKSAKRNGKRRNYYYHKRSNSAALRRNRK
jgi:hypothetical protein